jgi:hypothetical protein
MPSKFWKTILELNWDWNGGIARTGKIETEMKTISPFYINWFPEKETLIKWSELLIMTKK